MAVTNSPNMNLPIPGVGTEQGPNYAFDINQALTLLDQHDHSPGKGIQITPAGLNINSDLSFNDNNILALQSAVFQGQSAPLSTLLSLYVAPGLESPTPINDLWFTDGVGNQIQITSNGEVNATIASLPGESFAFGTFFWKQGTGSTVPANFDIGSITLRPNTAATTFGITLDASAVTSTYSWTLPSALPVPANNFLTVTNGGVISTISASGGITGSMIAPLTITGSNIAAGTITADKLASGVGVVNSQIFNTSGTFSVPAGVTTLEVYMFGGGGGGGGGGTTSNRGGGGGGSAALPQAAFITVTPSTNLTVTVGAGGSAGASGSAGGGGVSSSVAAGATTLFIAAGGAGGGSTSTVVGGNGGDQSNGSPSGGGAGGVGLLTIRQIYPIAGGGGGGNGNTGGDGTSGGAGAASPMNFTGGTGGGPGNAGTPVGGGGGGGASARANGGNGGTTLSATLPTAGSLGSGGGGGGAGQAGAAGGNGQVIVYWVS